MHHRFVQEGKGGSTMRSGASYSTWWNGGLRTTPYFHNSIGLLTEAQGSPNPLQIPFVPARQLPSNDLPLPVEPGTLHFRTSIEYSMTANWAVMDYASRNKDLLLFNIWRMGENSVEAGGQDSWTVTPSDIDRAAESLGGETASGSPEDYRHFLEDPGERDPRAFILPSDQADFPTAVLFANTLIKNGVEVQRATAPFAAQGKRYPAGSLVVMADQAYRPHLLDMFEPQDHPNDFEYPGGPPVPPYDAAGWTLAFQMAVDFDRILDPVAGPFESVGDVMPPPAGQVVGPADPQGFLLSHEVNNAFTAVFSLLREGRDVYWLTEPFQVGGVTKPAGTFFIPGGSDVRTLLEPLARNLGLTFEGVSRGPAGNALEMARPRIGLWDQYGGSMPSGWVRYILEEFDFDYSLVFPPELDAGNLADKFDVLIFPDGAIPSAGSSGRGGGGRGGSSPDLQSIPQEYRDRVGRVTAETTIPQLRDFLEQGGLIIALEGSTSLAEQLGLPVRNFLVDGDGNPLRSEEFYVPGSLLEVQLEHTSPVTQGLGDSLIVNYARSPVFALEPGARDVRPLAVYADEHPLRSGWAWGQEKLQGGVAMAQATVGEGTLLLFGPQVTFRGQPHGNYPLLFNGILLSRAQQTTLR